MAERVPSIERRPEETTSEHTARLLLLYGCVQTDFDEQFEIGGLKIKSPINIDTSTLLHYPTARIVVLNYLIHAVPISPKRSFTTIAGVANGSITWAAWVAEATGKPFIYVRSKPKGHGRGKQIEGKLSTNQRVVTIEDFVASGQTIANVARALRECHLTADQFLAIFSFGSKSTQDSLMANNIRLHSLTDLTTLIRVSEQMKFFSSSTIHEIDNWERKLSQE